MTVHSAWIRENMLDGDLKYSEKIRGRRNFRQIFCDISRKDRYERSPEILPIRSRFSFEKYNKTPIEMTANTKRPAEVQKSPDSGIYENLNNETRKSSLERPMFVMTSLADGTIIDNEIPNVKMSPNTSATLPKRTPSKKIDSINIPLPLPPKLDLSINSILNACENTVTSLDVSENSSFLEKKRFFESEKIRDSIVKAMKGTKAQVLDNTCDHSTSWTMSKKRIIDLQDTDKSYIPIETSKINSAFVPSTSTPNCRSSLSVNKIKVNEPVESKTGMPIESMNYEWKKEQLLGSSVFKEVSIGKSKITRKSLFLPEGIPRTYEKEQVNSPNTRFIRASKKSTEMEKIIKSKQTSGFVKEIVKDFNEKVKYSTMPTSLSRVSSCQEGTLAKNGSFVRKLAKAINEANKIEDEQKTKKQRKSYQVIENSSYVESSTDSEPGSSCGRDNVLQKSEYYLTYLKMKVAQKKNEDSVYWIPVPRRSLGRTSSLIESADEDSTLEQSSYCLSPIGFERRSESKKFCRCATWNVKDGATACLKAKKEADKEKSVVVTDSGISDKSDTEQTSVDYYSETLDLSLI